MTETPKKPQRILPPAPPPRTARPLEGQAAPPPPRPLAPVPGDAAATAKDGAAGAANDSAKDAAKPDPTRFGDWEKNGRCIDF